MLEPPFPDPPSLAVETVDGNTGRLVRARWNLGTGRVVAGPFSPTQRIDAEAVARQARAAEASRRVWEEAFVASGEALAEAVHVDELDRLAFTVRPPPGYVEAGRHGRPSQAVAAGVKHLRWVQPLWREAVLDLRVFGPDGLPLADAHVAVFSAAGRIWHPPITKRGPGELRIRGIPHLRGEPVRVLLDWGDPDPGEEEASEVVEEYDESTALEDAQVKTAIPAELSRPWQVDVHLKSLESPLLDTMEVDYDLEFDESWSETGGADPPKPATARIRVLGHDGQPVFGAFLEEVGSDPEGVIDLKGLVPGFRVLCAKARGRFPMMGEVTLLPGRHHEVTLREPRGARLEVFVVDAQGRPRPSARISLGGRLMFDVEDGVQRMDPHTDERGRRTFARVMPGAITVKAWWGTRSGKAEATLVDGETKTLRVPTR
ncbi:MAG: carboxypeptidase-like regulatory domain-containing protein [Planctomycetota bacterium]|nr:carboxypeptidase-like regulatory domain-containing protein [Planctomycetota bacterium]